MKKAVLILVLVMLWAIPAYSQTYQWVKYDDFSSGVINPDKWTVDSSSAIITVEDIGDGNMAVKFAHQPGYPGDSSWLYIKKNPVNVWGIKAKARIQNCQFVDANKSMRARIAGYIGLSQDKTKYIWGQLVIDPFRNDTENNPRIYSNIQVCNGECIGSDSWLGDIFFGNFWVGAGMMAEDLPGYWIPIQMEWTATQAKFKEGDEGTMIYKNPTDHKFVHITDPTKAVLGICSRSESGAGPCEVWFDDVYVLRQVY